MSHLKNNKPRETPPPSSSLSSTLKQVNPEKRNKNTICYATTKTTLKQLRQQLRDEEITARLQHRLRDKEKRDEPRRCDKSRRRDIRVQTTTEHIPRLEPRR